MVILLDIPIENESQEELDILVESSNSIGLSIWEKEFIMDCAERGWLSDKQSDIIGNIYRKYIDVVEE